MILPAFAKHIIGGELIYTRLTGNNYQITLKLYRDCSSPDAAEYDDPLQIYVYNASGILVDSLVIDFPGSEMVDADLSNPCIVNAPDLCVEQAVYIGTINLPDSPGGYDLVYQRCCRNSTILNLYDPMSTGATYTEHIPDPGSLINSSPQFNNLPPILICGSYPFSFDHAATDPDGDQLVYDFFTPYTGASFTIPDPSPAAPPPYFPVTYYPPYSETYPIASSPAFTINATSGILSGTPTSFGQFVVGIAVKEYRSGVLIGTHYRDFQFNITDCEPSIVAALPSEINNCTDYSVLFDNWSFGTDEFYWDFGDPTTTTDNSTLASPTYTYPDTGTYLVTLIAFPGETCSDTAFATVHIYPQLIPSIGFENMCAGVPVDFNDLSTTDFGTITTRQWNYGDGGGSTDPDPTHTYEEPGNYLLYFTVENSVGCTAELYDTITIYHLPFAGFLSDDACMGDTGTLYESSIVFAGNSIVDEQWTDPSGGTYSGDSIIYYFDTAGVYLFSLFVTTNYGCVDSVIDSVVVPGPISAAPLTDTLICEGDSVQLEAGGGINYEWIPSDGVSDPLVSDPFISPDITTTYGVIVSDACTADTAYVNIEVLPAPDLLAGPDTIIYHGNPVQMYAYGADGYEWSPPDGLTNPEIPDPIAVPDATTQYIITGTGKDGCISIDTALVYVIPNCFQFSEINAFSPNGDGINDRFRFVTSGDDALVQMEIYNRWGQLIFATGDMVNGWDGNDINGRPQEIGSYIYKIATQCDGILQSLSGSVTLLR